MKPLDIKSLTELRKKALDNIDDLVYNIRTRVREKDISRIKRGKTMKVDVNEFTRNEDRTSRAAERCKARYALVRDVADRLGVSVVLAGGAVRDTLLGLRERDYDFFIQGIPDEDKDDFLVYFTELLREKTGHLQPARSIDSAYPSTNFQGYELAPDLQFITRDEATPEDLVDAFDYDLVRCWYDGSWNIDERFAESLKAKRIICKDKRTWDRAQRFRDRTGFKITVGRPLKEPPMPGGNCQTPTTSTGFQIHSYTNYFEAARQEARAEALRDIPNRIDFPDGDRLVRQPLELNRIRIPE